VDSKVTCFNCGQHGHYATVCTNPQKPSADLKEVDQFPDTTVEDLEEQGKDEL